MGSFYTACALSGRTIKDGDDVVGFYLFETINYYTSLNFRTRSTYPWDLFRTVTHPIFGKAADCGRLYFKPEENTIAFWRMDELFADSNYFKEGNFNEPLPTCFYDEIRSVKDAPDDYFNPFLVLVHRDVFDYAYDRYGEADTREKFEKFIKHFFDDATEKQSVFLEYKAANPDDKDNFVKNFFPTSESMRQYQQAINLRSDAFGLMYDMGLSGRDELDVSVAMATQYSGTGFVHPKFADLFSKRFGFDNLPPYPNETYWQEFELFDQMACLMRAFWMNGRTLSPSLYMCQQDHFHDQFLFALHNMEEATKALLDEWTGEDEGYDPVRGEEYNKVDFINKSLSKLTLHIADAIDEYRMTDDGVDEAGT